MNIEPKYTFPVVAGTNQNRKQYVTSLPVRAIQHMAAPALNQKTKGAGLRQDRTRTRKVAIRWDSTGRIESITPIVFAISDTHDFAPQDQQMLQGFGDLSLPLSSILDVFDGIQRIAALESEISTSKNVENDQWPVHLIEIHSEEDATTLREKLTESNH